MTSCSYCHQPAIVTITARNPHGPITYRAAAACTTHKPRARAWAARAGPPVENPIPNQPDQQELSRLF